MTQTKIAFTVEKDDVLKYIRDHLQKEVSTAKCINGDELMSAVHILEEVMQGKGKDLRHALINLDNHRKALAKHDLRILECMEVIEGFYMLGEQVAEPPNLGELEKLAQEIADTERQEEPSE